MDTVRKLFICLAVTFAAGLLFVNIYNSVVDAPNWGCNIPGSIEVSRYYFKVANPGTFYRIFSPAAQAITLIALILCWTVERKVRYYLLAALVIAGAADAFTFGYFYPRNEIMFAGPIDGNVDAISLAHSQWSTANWLRSAICALGLIFDFAALNRFLGVRK